MLEVDATTIKVTIVLSDNGLGFMGWLLEVVKEWLMILVPKVS